MNRFDQAKFLHILLALSLVGVGCAESNDLDAPRRLSLPSSVRSSTHAAREISTPKVQLADTNSGQGTLITFQSPTSKNIERWFGRGPVLFNHNSVGMTRPLVAGGSKKGGLWWPSGEEGTISQYNDGKWRILRFQGRVGKGHSCYRAVCKAVLDWTFASPKGDKGMLVVDRTTRELRLPWRLVTFTRAGPLYVINPVSVVYQCSDYKGPSCRFTSTAYATQQNHLLRGEERVTVIMREQDGAVDVEILSCSRPAASIAGKIVWIVIGRMQRSFFEDQMSALKRVAKGASVGA